MFSVIKTLLEAEIGDIKTSFHITACYGPNRLFEEQPEMLSNFRCEGFSEEEFDLKNADYHFKLEGITALLKKMDYHDVTIAIDGSV